MHTLEQSWARSFTSCTWATRLVAAPSNCVEAKTAWPDSLKVEGNHWNWSDGEDDPVFQGSIADNTWAAHPASAIAWPSCHDVWQDRGVTGISEEVNGRLVLRNLQGLNILSATSTQTAPSDCISWLQPTRLSSQHYMIWHARITSPSMSFPIRLPIVFPFKHQSESPSASAHALWWRKDHPTTVEEVQAAPQNHTWQKQQPWVRLKWGSPH